MCHSTPTAPTARVLCQTTNRQVLYQETIHTYKGMQGPSMNCSKLLVLNSSLQTGDDFIKKAANDPSSKSMQYLFGSPKISMQIPDIIWAIAVFFNLAKRQGEKQITTPPRCFRKCSYIPDRRYTQDSAVTWSQHQILTKSMRSLRFFSICCGGRRLIKSKAQSSCWSLCRNKSIPPS